MYKEIRHTSDPQTALRYFLMEDIRGHWVSRNGDRCRMPELRIYRTGVYHHRIEFSYDPHTVFNCQIKQRWGVTFFFLYGRITVTYDRQRDILILSDYGEYVRCYDDPK